MSAVMPRAIARAANTTNKLTPEMQQQLEQLRDIHLPEPVSWFPMAIGWWLLIVLLIIALILIYRKIDTHRRVYKHPAYLSAIDELSRLPVNAKGNSAKLAGDLSALLKRVGLYHNLPIATLSGDEWADYLTQNHVGDAQGSASFSQAQADFIANGAYAKYADVSSTTGGAINNNTAKQVPDWQGLEATAQHWIITQFKLAANPKRARQTRKNSKVKTSSKGSAEMTEPNKLTESNELTGQKATKQNEETV